MKTWIHVERRLERMCLPYRVQDETLVTLDGTHVAVTVQGARDFLASPGHPDSKRQQRSKQRSLTRYGARLLKESESHACVCPPRPTNKRREFRDMQRRMAEDRRIFAAVVAARLQGKSWVYVPGGMEHAT